MEPVKPTPFQPADNLYSRTFIGLLIAQFLAAFNDQAIHASAMFFAINQNTLNEAGAISLMPILFYAPWALFSTVAGYLADRYSKRDALVFWKLAEVLITGIALAGFWLGSQGYRSGPWIVLSTVFLMGTHSAFFVPAKYGAMPEILQSHMLSRGNGLLESFSFLAIILGTVCGGVLSFFCHGREYIIGIVLVALAVIGALASLVIERMPAANPHRRFPFFIFGPLYKNLQDLFRSRPLAFAVVGIAFFTFIVGFMRATVYMHGESQINRWTELETSVVVGMVALGIGIGSPLVGFLSGGKVELGLIPIGAVGMMAATMLASIFLGWISALVACIICIGFFTGFYIVPLFTLLQHRAPKISKGDSIATSNLINVTGAILASLVFYGIDHLARKTGFTPEIKQTEVLQGSLMSNPVYKEGRPFRIVIGDMDIQANADEGQELYAIGVDEDDTIDPFRDRLKEGDKVILSTYRRGKVTHYRIRRQGELERPVYDKHALPSLLFLSAGAMTFVTLLVLWMQLPSLFTRTLLWLRRQGRVKLEVFGLNHMPDRGPALLVTCDASAETCLQILSATDRTTRFLMPRDPFSPRYSSRIQRDLAKGLRALRAGNAVGLTLQSCAPTTNNNLPSNGSAHSAPSVPVQTPDRLFDDLKGQAPCPIVPIYTLNRPPLPGKHLHTVFIVLGEPLPAGASVHSVRQAIEQLKEYVELQLAASQPIEEQAMVGFH